jgi:hypothetical protein
MNAEMKYLAAMSFRSELSGKQRSARQRDKRQRPYHGSIIPLSFPLACSNHGTSAAEVRYTKQLPFHLVFTICPRFQ